MSVAIVTAIYGGSDDPAPLAPQDIECDAVMVTDRPCQVDGWRNVVEPRSHLAPRMASKIPKARPDLYADAEHYVWVDGSFHVRAPSFARWCVEHHNEPMAATVSAYQHPYHNDIAEEAALAETLPKYAGQDLRTQATRYRAQGFPLTWGLWATGLMVYSADRVAEIGTAWLREMMYWSVEDQVSLPYVLWGLGVKANNLPFRGWTGNDLFHMRPHAKDV